MHALVQIKAKLLQTAELFEPRGMWLAIGRSVLAASTASAIALTPDSALFVSVQGQPGVRCDGIRGISLWCIGEPGDIGWTSIRVLALIVLGIVVTGYRPRWTCVPHWFVTFSLAASMTQPNGGDQVAQIASMLLIPICLADGRAWQWNKPPSAISPVPRGAALACILVIRIQIAIIYAEAAISKLIVREWRDGTAMYSVVRDPNYGFPPALADPLDGRILSVLTWGTIAAELAIAILILGGRTMRRKGFLLALALHIGIGLTMGLPSFAAIMVGTLAIGQSGHVLAHVKPELFGETEQSGADQRFVVN